MKLLAKLCSKHPFIGQTKICFSWNPPASAIRSQERAVALLFAVTKYAQVSAFVSSCLCPCQHDAHDKYKEWTAALGHLFTAIPTPTSSILTIYVSPGNEQLFLSCYGRELQLTWPWFETKWTMRVTICPFIILLKEIKSIFFHSWKELTFVPSR